jgi:hypothetical protein
MALVYSKELVTLLAVNKYYYLLSLELEAHRGA